MRSILLLLAAALHTSAHAADLHVKTTGDDASNACTNAAAPCKTIAAALVTAASGDTVMVHAGTYSATSSGNLPLIVPAGVAVVGDGADTTVVRPISNVDGPIVIRTFFEVNNGASIDSLQINGDGLAETGVRFTSGGQVTLSNLILQNLETALDVNGELGDIQVVVEGTTFNDNGTGFSLSTRNNSYSVDLKNIANSYNRNGTAIDYYTSNHQGNNTVQLIDGQFIDNLFGVDLSVSSGALSLNLEGATLSSDNPQTTSRHVQLSLNNMDNPAVNIQNNTIDGSKWANLHINVKDNSLLALNIIENTIRNSNYGVEVYATGDSNAINLLLSGNTITHNTKNGVSLGNTESTGNAYYARVVNNVITHNGERGLLLENRSAHANNLIVDLVSNNISNNSSDGINLYIDSGAFAGAFAGNVITDNTGNGINISSTDRAGFYLRLSHNTIKNNAAGYTTSSAYDIYNDAYDFPTYAADNFFGTTDTDVIDSHIYNRYDTIPVKYTALPSDLTFELRPPVVSTHGGLVTLSITEGAFVPTAADLPFVVLIDGQPSGPTTIAPDGRSVTVRVPAHDKGTVDISVTNPGGQAGTLAAALTFTEFFIDSDNDGVIDSSDNCVDTANEDQLDTDSDGMGDLCDDDLDGDGTANADDVCVGDDSTGDTDADGLCNDTDTDDDGDGVLDEIDPCPETSGFADADGDGQCDTYDLCIGDDATGDSDGDGYCASDLDGAVLDCDDANADISPGAAELCDGLDVDENCDGVIDEVCIKGGCSVVPGSSAGWLMLGLSGLLMRRRE